MPLLDKVTRKCMLTWSSRFPPAPPWRATGSEGGLNNASVREVQHRATQTCPQILEVVIEFHSICKSPPCFQGAETRTCSIFA